MRHATLRNSTRALSQLMIWSVPEFHRRPLAIETAHRANIFGVQFLPCTGDEKLVSGSMDHTVQV